MNTAEIKKVLEGAAPNGYRFNQFEIFGFPYKKMTKIVRVKHNPDDHLTKIYHVILKAVISGFSHKNELLTFLGTTENDDFICNEIKLLCGKGLLEDDSDNLCVTELGDLYMNDNFSIMIEEPMHYNFLVDTISGNIVSCSSAKNLTDKEPQKSLKPDPQILQQIKKLIHKKEDEIRDTFHKDFSGKVQLLDVIGDYPNSSFVWDQFIIAEYTCEDDGNMQAAPKYIVRSADDLTINKDLTTKFNTGYSQYIPSLLY